MKNIKYLNFVSFIINKGAKQEWKISSQIETNQREFTDLFKRYKRPGLNFSGEAKILFKIHVSWIIFKSKHYFTNANSCFFNFFKHFSHVLTLICFWLSQASFGRY